MNIATARRTTEIADLGGHQHRASPAATAARRHAVGGFHDGGQIGSRRLYRGDEAKEHRASHGDDQAEQQRTPIQLERQRDGQIRRYLDLPEERHAGVADGETQDAARERDQQAFRHQLADQPAASGADRETQRHLARAGRCAAGQQPRDVRACDEQHGKRERGQHRDQHRVRRILCDSRLELGSYRETAILVRVRVGALQIGGNRRQLALRAGLRHARLEASLERQGPGVARFERCGLRIADQARRHHHRDEEVRAHELV